MAELRRSAVSRRALAPAGAAELDAAIFGPDSAPAADGSADLAAAFSCHCAVKALCSEVQSVIRAAARTISMRIADTISHQSRIARLEDEKALAAATDSFYVFSSVWLGAEVQCS